MSDTPLATCSAQEWTFNSLGQSPCQVGAELGAACTGGAFRLPPLPPNNQYEGPNNKTENSCRCSTVYYSLLSACAHCQQRSYIRWSAYQKECSVVYLENFPQPIPVGVAVPLWAYEPVQDKDTFDPDAAQKIVGEVTNTKPSKSPPPNAKDDSEVNIGLVVGASVGGFVFLLIVGISIFFLLRRRKRRRRPRELVHHEVNILGDDYEPTAPVTLPQHLTPLSTSDHFTGTTMATMSAPSHQSGPLKLYNPDDPSTWPHNFDMYPHRPSYTTSNPSHSTTSGAASPLNFGQRSATALSSDQSEPVLPNFTGISSITAVTQARTTFGDPRYKDIEL